MVSVIEKSSKGKIIGVQARQAVKLAQLKQASGLNNLDNNTEYKQIITNISNVQLSNEEVKLLEKGLNYRIAPYKLQFSDYLAPFKHFSHRLSK